MALTPQQEILETVPQSIRSWLSSDTVIAFLQGLAKRLGLHRERARVLPFALFRLVIKDIHPAEFINTLSEELIIGHESARTIAAELVMHVLAPIKPALDAWGVNVDLVDAETAEASARAVHEEPSEAALEEAKEEIEKAEPEETKEEREEGETKPGDYETDVGFPGGRPISLMGSPTSGSEGKPFILHTEAEAAATEEETPRKRFSLSSLGGGFFGNAPQTADGAPGAEVNLPKFLNKSKQKPEQKVVHYSERRMPNDNAGNDQGFIDLSTIESRQGEAEPPRGTPEVKPNIKGNTIDLRGENGSV